MICLPRRFSRTASADVIERTVPEACRAAVAMAFFNQARSRPSSDGRRRAPLDLHDHTAAVEEHDVTKFSDAGPDAPKDGPEHEVGKAPPRHRRPRRLLGRRASLDAGGEGQSIGDLSNERPFVRLDDQDERRLLLRHGWLLGRLQPVALDEALGGVDCCAGRFQRALGFLGRHGRRVRVGLLGGVPARPQPARLDRHADHSLHALGGVVDRITIRCTDHEHVDVVGRSARLAQVPTGPRPEQEHGVGIDVLEERPRHGSG